MGTAGSDASTTRMADPRISRVLMLATYAIGGAGYVIGFARIGPHGAADAVKWVALLSVGVVGVISMVRHSIFHRSDAARMGWDLGRRNNFQIEVGFANLAIGAAAIAAVLFEWGTAALAAITLAYAIYFLQVAALVLVDRDHGRIDIGRLVSMLLQCGFLGYFALAALHSLGVRPF
jgi:hypothetical protein